MKIVINDEQNNCHAAAMTRNASYHLWYLFISALNSWMATQLIPILGSYSYLCACVLHVEILNRLAHLQCESLLFWLLHLLSVVCRLSVLRLILKTKQDRKSGLPGKNMMSDFAREAIKVAPNPKLPQNVISKTKRDSCKISSPV